MTNLSKNNPPVLVITGSSRGIGFGIANFFIGKGYTVVGCSRGPSTIENTNYKHFTLDVCNESAVRSWVREVKKDFNKIDILVCNAGLVRLGALTAVTSLDSFKSFHDSILNSTFLVNACSRNLCLCISKSGSS